MKHVKYTGDNPVYRKGETALMRKDGLVQLDGPKDMWRSEPEFHPMCFGWHDLGDEWEGE